jgi:hypothetical protein
MLSYNRHSFVFIDAKARDLLAEVYFSLNYINLYLGCKTIAAA